jgi:hypothetical protein
MDLALSPIGSPGHHWSVVACGGMSIGHKTLAVAAKTLASTAIDLYGNPVLLEAMWAEWKDKTKGIEYTSAIPEGQKPPQFKEPVQFFGRLEANPATINFGTSVGTAPIREIVIGTEDRPATEEELAEMERLVAEATRLW